MKKLIDKLSFGIKGQEGSFLHREDVEKLITGNLKTFTALVKESPEKNIDEILKTFINVHL